MVILPPMGIAVTLVNPNVMVALLDVNLPGTLSSELVKAISTPALSRPPSAWGMFTSLVNFKSTDVAIFTEAVTVAERTVPPVVIVPGAKVNV